MLLWDYLLWIQEVSITFKTTKEKQAEWFMDWIYHDNLKLANLEHLIQITYTAFPNKD